MYVCTTTPLRGTSIDKRHSNNNNGYEDQLDLSSMFPLSLGPWIALPETGIYKCIFSSDIDTSCLFVSCIYLLQFYGSTPYSSISRNTIMGLKEIRTALKVDFDKPAWEQPGLHVCKS